jgi:hypothetical protein
VGKGLIRKIEQEEKKEGRLSSEKKEEGGSQKSLTS